MFARALHEDEWKAYRDLRLEALAGHEDGYGGSLSFEAARDDVYWQDMFAQKHNKFFGLFDRDTMIGIGAVVRSREDKSGRTALLIAGYVREEYRQQGLSSLLYDARIRWIVESNLFDKVAVSHKQGNEASRRANQRFGFQKTGEENVTWGDGSQGIKHNYEMRVR